MKKVEYKHWVLLQMLLLKKQIFRPPWECQ